MPLPDASRANACDFKGRSRPAFGTPAGCSRTRRALARSVVKMRTVSFRPRQRYLRPFRSSIVFLRGRVTWDQISRFSDVRRVPSDNRDLAQERPLGETLASVVAWRPLSAWLVLGAPATPQSPTRRRPRRRPAPPRTPASLPDRTSGRRPAAAAQARLQHWRRARPRRRRGSRQERRARPVAHAADFELQEDGVAQEIKTFQYVQNVGQADTDDEVSLTIRSRSHAAAEAAKDNVRLFLIFWDEYHIGQMMSANRARTYLTQFVRTAFGPTDIVGFMDPLTPIDAIEFTRDRLELAEQVRQARRTIGRVCADAQRASRMRTCSRAMSSGCDRKSRYRP